MDRSPRNKPRAKSIGSEGKEKEATNNEAGLDVFLLHNLVDTFYFGKDDTSRARVC
jgi:hypothetical protein